MSLESLPFIGGTFTQIGDAYRRGKDKQGLAGKVALEGMRGGVQGCVMGVAMAQLAKSFNKSMDESTFSKNMNPDMRKAMTGPGGGQPLTPRQNAQGLGAFMAVQCAVAELLKHKRKEKDMWNACAPAS